MVKNEILDLLGGSDDDPAFLTAKMALPPDHWLYAPQCPYWDTGRGTAADLPLPVLANDQRAAAKAAMRWAVRAATMNGADKNFDPDALVQNAVYALCGPMGLSHEL